MREHRFSVVRASAWATFKLDGGGVYVHDIGRCDYVLNVDLAGLLSPCAVAIDIALRGLSMSQLALLLGSRRRVLPMPISAEQRTYILHLANEV